MKNIKKNKIQNENHEHHENPKIQLEKHETREYWNCLQEQRKS